MHFTALLTIIAIPVALAAPATTSWADDQPWPTDVAEHGSDFSSGDFEGNFIWDEKKGGAHSHKHSHSWDASMSASWKAMATGTGGAHGIPSGISTGKAVPMPTSKLNIQNFDSNGEGTFPSTVRRQGMVQENGGKRSIDYINPTNYYCTGISRGLGD